MGKWFWPATIGLYQQSWEHGRENGECQLKMIRFEGTINPSVVFWLLSRLGSDGTARAPWISASCQ
jgi:hypothetical protein